MSHPRPSVNCGRRQLDRITQECLKHLEDANDPPVLFVRGGELVRVKIDETARASIEMVGDHELRCRLAEVADFYRPGKNENISTYPPIPVVQNVRALGEWPFPPLEGVTEIPVMRPDGTIFSTPGYDPPTCLVYKPSPALKFGSVPDRPSHRDVVAAVRLIDEAIGEFPYVDEVSRANAIGLFISTALRRLISGLAPLALIDAPNAGTGKGLLTNVCSILPTGRAALVKPYPGTEEELRKTIGSMMLEGTSIACFDNLDRKLDSPTLAAVLTSDIYSDRILGLSRNMRIPNRAI